MRKKSLIFSMVMLAALVLSACGPAAVASGSDRTLNVTGVGQVFITPDIAYLYIGVHTEQPTAAEAVAGNNAQTQQVIDALKSFGVDEKDIHTSSFSIWPIDRYDPATGTNTGEKYYAVDNQVYVTARDLTKLGALLDTVIQAGANSINSIQFDLADKTEVMKQARAEAVKNAQSQAEELAGLASVSLVEITNISYTDSTPYAYAEYGRGGGGGGIQANVPIEPGQMTITANVSVTYKIK
ncbi:MAG: SIMPL domain-containing protein [Chloroflexota bacterium]